MSPTATVLIVVGCVALLLVVIALPFCLRDCRTPPGEDAKVAPTRGDDNDDSSSSDSGDTTTDDEAISVAPIAARGRRSQVMASSSEPSGEVPPLAAAPVSTAPDAITAESAAVAQHAATAGGAAGLHPAEAAPVDKPASDGSSPLTAGSDVRQLPPGWSWATDPANGDVYFYRRDASGNATDVVWDWPIADDSPTGRPSSQPASEAHVGAEFLQSPSQPGASSEPGGAVRCGRATLPPLFAPPPLVSPTMVLGRSRAQQDRLQPLAARVPESSVSAGTKASSDATVPEPPSADEPPQPPSVHDTPRRDEPAVSEGEVLPPRRGRWAGQGA